MNSQADDWDEEGTSNKKFRTELFGFDRVEVLTYIERISAANAEKARALADTIESLQRDLTDARGQSSALERQARAVFNELQTEKKRAENAVAEADALRAEVKKANDEKAAIQSRLFAQEQENATLQGDNARLSATVENLKRALSQNEERAPQIEAGEREKTILQHARIKARDILREADAQAEAKLREARRAAASIFADAARGGEGSVPTERAAGRAPVSIAELHEQLAEVDARILEATSQLQRATDGIAATLQADGRQTEENIPPADGEGSAREDALTAPYPEKKDSDTYVSVTEGVTYQPMTPQTTVVGGPAADNGKTFGKPHLPRAMPFAPFEPDTGYAEVSAEVRESAAHAEGVSLPRRDAQPPRSYVPRPTPVGPAQNVAKPLEQHAATALARIPQIQSTPVRPAKPVIIPYSAPVPAPDLKDTGDGTRAASFSESWERAAHQTGAEEPLPHGSALSEDLLAHLDQLINGDKKV